LSENKSTTPMLPQPSQSEQQPTQTETQPAGEQTKVVTETQADANQEQEGAVEVVEQEGHREEVTYASPGGIPQKQAPTSGREESGSAVVAKALAPQLGSSPAILEAHHIDERKMAVLNDLTQTALGYFNYRGKVDHVRFFRWISNWELVSSQAVGGLARRHILQAISAASGVTVAEVAGRPNMIARNITNRNWKTNAIRSGKVVVDE